MWGEPDRQNTGAPHRGVAIMARKELGTFQRREDEMPDARRIVALSAPRNGARPVLFVCIYAQSGHDGGGIYYERDSLGSGHW